MTLLLLAVIAIAPVDHYEQGNRAYEAGEYELSIAWYDSALARAESPEVWYNRGNARFKLGEAGRALADYHRARALAPRDPDIAHNIRFVRAWRRDRTTTLANPIIEHINRLLRFLPFGIVRALTGLLFLLTAVGFGLLALTRQRHWLWPALGLLVLLAYSAGAWLSWAAEINPSRAVVVVPDARLRSGPGEEYQTLLTVHDGLEAKIRETRGEWLLIETPDAQAGWTEANAVEPIFPGR